jgi:L-alanine-DL-glutamate epimerase-like enolase superfamily enzyme
MAKGPKITGIEVHQFSYQVEDMGRRDDGLGTGYMPGSTMTRTAYALRIMTDRGPVGEFVGGRATDYAALPQFSGYLIGHDALQRELIYARVNQILRATRVGLAPVDIALWDLAGKYHNAPIHQLLGGYKETLPTYVATLHGEEEKTGGLDNPEAYADFAEQCLELGYGGFKIHGWENGLVEREIATVHAVGQRVGGRMDMMLDPFNALQTLGDAIKVGKACDEEGFFWYEDPFGDAGTSMFAHRKLRQILETPLMMTEHIRGLEPHVDFMVAEATDFVRGDVMFEGITGVMKVAHAAEGLGMDIEFHSPGPAQRQCVAAIRNTNYYELSVSHLRVRNQNYVPVYRDDYRDDLDAADENGDFPVPQGPGLGVEYDWDFIEKHRTGLVKYP